MTNELAPFPRNDSSGAGAIGGTQPKPYPSIDEIAALTPWTVQAIRSMIKRGVLIENRHYFRVGRRIVFKWSAIVDFIERGMQGSQPRIPLRRSRTHEPAQA
jgi:hypothetical protein